MIDVPIYLQEKETTCFAASIRMVLDYLGINKSETRIVKEMRIKPENGAYITDVADYLQLKNNVQVSCPVEFATPDDAYSTLEYFVQNECPVIVQLDPDCGTIPSKLEQGLGLPDFHMAVVVETNKQFITLNDPAYGRIVKTYDEFMNQWYNNLIKGQMCAILE